MTRSEEIIIKGFLMGAYKAVEDARARGNENLDCKESAYDIICRLAEQLKVENPCEK
jgi:hypothetical protein